MENPLVPGDLTVTDAQFFTAIENILLYGDIDELPVEPDLAPYYESQEVTGWDSESVTRAVAAMVFRRLARGEILPKELGVREDVATVTRWMKQRKGGG